MQIIIADSETASLSRPAPPATGVVQAAWLEIEAGPDGKFACTKEHMHLLDPGMPIDQKASEIHGFYDIDVVGKPTLFEVFDLKGPVFFIAHNKAFDLPRFAAGIENLVGGLCTLMGARRHCKDSPDHKLTTLVEHYQLPVHKAHDALGDCYMTLGLLNLLIERSGMPLLELAKHVHTPKVPTEMPFGKHKGKAFRDLPSDYIVYVLGYDDLDEGLRTALNMQRRLRGNAI